MGNMTKANSSQDLEPLLDKKVGFAEILALASGILAGGKKEAVLSAGRIAQAAFSGRAKEQFIKEVERLKKEGRIPDDFEKSSGGWECFIAALKGIEESSGEEQMKAISAVFLGIATEGTKDNDTLMSYERLKVVASLDSASVILLRNVWEGLKNPDGYLGDDFADAADALRSKCGLAKHYQYILVRASKQLSFLGILGTDDFTNLAKALVENNRNILCPLGLDICKLLEAGTVIQQETGGAGDE